MSPRRKQSSFCLAVNQTNITNSTLRELTTYEDEMGVILETQMISVILCFILFDFLLLLVCLRWA